MKLNNKGTTLIELLVSIILIGIVMTFMFKLLLDVNNDNTNNDFAKDNQVIRTEIIKNIEEDLNGKTIINITTETPTNEVKIKFYFQNGSPSELNLTNRTLTYVNSLGEKRKWTMKNCNIYLNKISVNHIKNATARIFVFIINIEIHTNNDKNTVFTYDDVTKKVLTSNNKIDDITINYCGKYYENIDFIENLYCIGNGC